MINADDPDNIWRFYAEGEVTRIVNVGKAIIGLDEKETIKIKQSLNNSDIRPLLFSKGIIFVEGPSDKIVIEKTDAALSLQEKGPKISENEWNVIAIGSKYDLRHFTYLAKMLKINYISIMDNDALMICDRKMVMNGVFRETSPIFLALSELNDLKQYDIDSLCHIQTTQLKNKEGKLFQSYDPQSFSTLDAIAKSYNIFVWSKKLEDILGVSVSKKIVSHYVLLIRLLNIFQAIQFLPKYLRRWNSSNLE